VKSWWVVQNERYKYHFLSLLFVEFECLECLYKGTEGVYLILPSPCVGELRRIFHCSQSKVLHRSLK
jgi:hypothetical protein